MVSPVEGLLTFDSLVGRLIIGVSFLDDTFTGVTTGFFTSRGQLVTSCDLPTISEVRLSGILLLLVPFF